MRETPPQNFVDIDCTIGMTRLESGSYPAIIRLSTSFFVHFRPCPLGRNMTPILGHEGSQETISEVGMYYTAFSIHMAQR